MARMCNCQGLILSLVLLLAGCVAAFAQPGFKGSIRGGVVLPNGGFLSEPVKLTLQSVRGIRASIYTDGRGQFQFTGLAPGTYQITVEADKDRFETTSANVEVSPGGPALLTITLREKAGAAKSKSDSVISATELDPAIPAKARKEFGRATEATRNRKSQEAVEHLRKAIALYPNYLMARNDLGVALFSQGNLEEAATELRLAIALDAKAFNPRLNLGIVLVQQEKYSDAAESLRKALALEGNSPAARLYLGIALKGQQQFEEAERELTAAYDLGGAQYALALYHLGHIYLTRGDRERARKAFEAYLRAAPQGLHIDEVRKIVNILR